MKLLSIIVPFHNSEKKCSRLLSTLAVCSDESVELIFIDDGSQDKTLNILYSFKKQAKCFVTIIEQENKGPGGARNAGLDVAKGTYLWFVDSDDDIDLDAALCVLRKSIAYDPDFIDLNISSKECVFSSMNLSPGIYYGDETLFMKFGRICSKIFNQRVFKFSEIRYPEYCIYEDNALLFLLPHFVERYLVSEVCGYIHQEEHESVTRGARSDRYYDRMLTAFLGYSIGANLSSEDLVKEIMKSHFIRLYLINTIGLTRFPSKQWLEKARVMSEFRRVLVEERLVVSYSKIANLLEEKGCNKKYKLVFFTLYFISKSMPSQKKYFEEKRFNAWGKKSQLSYDLPLIIK